MTFEEFFAAIMNFFTLLLAGDWDAIDALF